MKQYKQSKLPNGLRVITGEDPNSDIITLSVWARAGSRYENKQQRGYSHILEHMLLKGTKNRPSAFEIGLIADRAGAYFNAFTSKEFIQVIIQVAKSQGEKMFALLADIILNPLLESKVLEKEKQVIIQELKHDQDNHYRRLWMESLKRIFQGHPLSNYPLGNERTILSATSEKLREYHVNFFKPNRAAIITSGAISHEKVLALARKELGHWQKGKDIKDYLISPKIKRGEDFLMMPGTQTHLFFGFAGPKSSFKDSLALDLIADYLGHKHTSLLYQELRHKLGLVYNLSTHAVAYQDATLFSIVTSSSKPKDVLSIILDKALSLEKYFTKELFREHKEQLINVLLRKLNDPFAEIRFLGSYWVLHDHLIPPQRAIKTIQHLTYQDILNVKNTYLTKNNLFVMALGEKRLTLNCDSLMNKLNRPLDREKSLE